MRVLPRCIVALCALLPLACGGEEAATGPDAGKPLQEVVERGPIKVISRVDDAEPSIGELVRFTLTVEAPAGIEIKMPPADNVLSQYEGLLRSERSTDAKELPDGRLQWSQWLGLDVYRSGEFTLPARTVQYRDRRKEPKTAKPATTQADEKPWTELASKPLKIKLKPVAPEDADPAGIMEDATPADPPTPPMATWVWWTLGALALVIVLLTVWAAVRRRRRRGEPGWRMEPAHVRALRMLERIAAMQLVEQGRIEEFYFRVSSVLRQYIEDRFGLRAPERTTTEFLTELATADALSDSQKQPLGEFLRHCDMVKFARYGPDRSEIQSAFNLVQHFIATTRTEEPQVPVDEAPQAELVA